MKTISSAHRGGAERQRANRLWNRPHWQIAALALLGSVLAVILIGVGQSGRASANSRLDLVNHKLIPASELFEETAAHLAAAQRDLVALNPVQSPTDQQIALGGARNEVSAAQAAWAGVADHRAHLPGEQRWISSFAEAFRSYRTTQTAAIGHQLGIDPSPAFSNAAAADSLTMHSALRHLTALYERTLVSENRAAEQSIDTQQALIRYGGVAALSFFALLCLFAVVAQRRREARLQARAVRHARDAERARLETELSRALEMSDSEEASFELVRDAISENIQCVGVELMLADSSRAHFSPVFSMPDGFTGCGVGSPRACPATSGTQVQRFPRSDALAACPHLRRGRDRPCSAVCIPLAIAGKSVGVLHAVDVVGEEADSDFVETLMLVSRKAGERLSALRALARTETQARTDALTGLLNRRSLEDEVKALVDDGRHFVVAFADLDHFKQLNDVHGHDTGDRALRLFGQVLSDGVRPADLVARYGGEEFVLVLPDCSVSDAINVVERLRTRLTTQLTDGRLPGFTVSVGIASSSGRASFGTTLDAADAALLKAKAQGRDRIVVDGTAIEIEPPSASQHAGPQIAA